MSLVRLQLKSQLDLQSSESLTGAGGSASKMAHLYGSQVHVGSVPYHMGLSLGLLEWPYEMTRFLTSPRVSDPRESKAEATITFMS